MSMIKSIIGWTAVVCMLPATAFGGDTLGKIRDTHTITLAYRTASPPFSYLDGNTQPIGYSVDLCLAIVDGIKNDLKIPKLQVRFLPVDTSSRFDAIIGGKADLECGTATNNAERRTRIAFTIPHFFAGVRALVRTDSGIHNWPDLRGKTVVTTKSTTSIKLLDDRSNVRSLNIKLIEADDDPASFKMIEQGKADVFPMDDVLLYGLRAGAAAPDRFAVVGDPLSVEPYAIMLRKDDPAFKHAVDAQMVRIINDGAIYRIYDRWFMQPIPPKGINMRMPMGYLLRDSLRFPSDQVGN